MNTERLKKLQASLKNPILIKKKENLLYLTGRSFFNGYLLVNPSQPPLLKRGGVIKKSFYVKSTQEELVFLGDGLEKIDTIKSDRLKNISLYLGIAKTLEIENVFSFAEWEYLKAKSKEKKVKIQAVRSPVDIQRAIKEPREILLVKKSMQIVERVFSLVRKEIVKTGMTETKLAKFIEATGLKMGAHDVSFPAIVASGVNASVPHHVPSSKRLKAGESIILDFGFKYKNYCSDFTRTVFLKKVGSKKIEEAYNQVEKAYVESINLFDLPSRVHPRDPLNNKGKGIPRSEALSRNGKALTGNDLYQKAVSVLAEKKLDKYFIHSLGHGTGLEIHELPNLSPNSKDILKDAMLFSIEPGVYMPKLGGIRIEDLVFLDNGKVKKFINVPTNLTSNIL